MKPAVARAALEAGASIVNDVAANRRDGEMWKIVAEFRAGYICMHAQGTPRTMQKNPTYKNVVREVGAFFGGRLEKLNAAGVAAGQIVFDPGIGFGKTAEHNLQLLAGLRHFTKWRRPLLLGVSRKSFLGKFPARSQISACPRRSPARLWRWRRACKSSARTTWRKPCGRCGWPKRCSPGENRNVHRHPSILALL